MGGAAFVRAIQPALLSLKQPGDWQSTLVADSDLGPYSHSPYNETIALSVRLSLMGDSTLQ